MSLVARALWVIERNLYRELTLTEIAASCEASRYHLAHAFGEATGHSVMEYVRGRRLTEAAYALSSGAAGILDVALEAGYASHEAFSRAFRAKFDITPEDLRERASVAGLKLVPALRAAERVGAALEPPTFEDAGELSFVGMRERCSYEGLEDLPARWQRFMMTSYAAIPHKTQSIPVGIAAAIHDNGDFDYLCAAEVLRFGDIPSGLSSLKVPPQTYAVFQHRDHVMSLHKTYDAIWNDWLPASHCTAVDAACLEHHNPGFDPRSGQGGLTIWVPVKRSLQR